MSLFDTHCHLLDEKNKKSAEEIIKDSQEAGVNLFVNIGTNLKDNQKAITLAEKHKNVFCAVGITPDEDMNLSLTEIENSLREQIKKSKKVVAVGECGIDSPPLKASDEQGISGLQKIRDLKFQIELFEMQVKLAVEFNLPLVIHNRNGDEQVLAVVEKYAKQGLTGVCHCFVQDWDYAQKMLGYGFYLGFGGIITYSPSSASWRTTEGHSILETVKNAPGNRVLIETDSPYLAPGNLRRSINEPKNIGLVAQKIAETRGISYDEVCKLTYENGKTLFKINTFGRLSVN